MILAINTASSTSSLALFENESLILEKSWPAANDEAEKIMPTLDKMLQEKNLDYKDIDKVLVIKGPGSFTGLRIGVTVGNTIAYLNKAKLYAVDTFTYHWNGFSLEDKSDVALIVFAGKGGLYISQNADAPDYQNKAQVININEVGEFLKSHGIKKVFGDFTEEQKAQIEGVEFLESENFAKIVPKLLKQNLEELKIIEPSYIKKPSISESKKTTF